MPQSREEPPSEEVKVAAPSSRAQRKVRFDDIIKQIPPQAKNSQRKTYPLPALPARRVVYDQWEVKYRRNRYGRFVDLDEFKQLEGEHEGNYVD